MFLVCSNSCLFCIGHLFACFITDQQWNFSFGICSFLAWNSHFFHIKAHADLWFFFNHIKDHGLDCMNLFHRFILLAFNVQMKVFNGHWTNSLAIKSFDCLYLFTDPPALNNYLFDLRIAQQSLLTKFLTSFFEDCQASKLLPGLKIFLSCI